MAEKHFEIEVFSHNFRIKILTEVGRDLIRRFGSKYIQYTFSRSRGEVQKTIAAVYATREGRSNVYRFHINQLEPLLNMMREWGFSEDSYTQTKREPNLGAEIKLEVRPEWVLREHQVEIPGFLNDPNENNQLVGIQTGLGKAVHVDTPIKIPGGWTTMGDIQLGDEVVGPDGNPTKVIGVYPQGVVPLYRVTFADGRSVRCCAQHLWKVYYINTVPNRRWRVVDTLEMLRLISMPNPRVYVELIQSEEGINRELPIDPYLLGVILGDGHIGCNVITITKNDQFIFDEIAPLLPKGNRLSRHNKETLTYSIIRDKASSNTNVLHDELKKLGLAGKYSYQKFIPEEYLLGSREQRLSLLQGLLDTDGTVGNERTGSGSVSYSTSSLTLAENVQYLVRSLGGIATIGIKHPHYTYKGEYLEGREAYIIGIRIKKPSDLFRLPRKKRLTNDENQYADILKLRVASVEKDGEGPAQCIAVDNPEHLYVIKDFIVTHNTFVSLFSAAQLQKRIAIVMRAQFLKKWEQDCMDVYKVKRKDIMVIKGSASLDKAVELAHKKKLKAKIILFSNRTLQNYLTTFESSPDLFLNLGHIHPQELYPTLGVGVVINDEVHLDFHLNYCLYTYMHTGRSYALSATLIDDSPFMENMYSIVFPVKNRFKGGAYNKYIATTAILWSLYRPEKVRTSEYGSSMYSHTAFEKSIMKHVPTLTNYMKLIDDIVKGGYIKHKDRKPGHKLLILCATIDFATKLTKYLEREYPDMDVRRYVEDDPYENLLDADIRVSTILSSGTGHDIKNLFATIMTTGVKSPKSNLQAFGRTRAFADGTTPRFYYMACRDIPKQMDYHIAKMELLTSRSVSFYTDIMPRVV